MEHIKVDFELQPITKEFLDSLNPIDKHTILKKHHKWLRDVRASDKKFEQSRMRKIMRFAGVDTTPIHLKTISLSKGKILHFSVYVTIKGIFRDYYLINDGRKLHLEYDLSDIDNIKHKPLNITYTKKSP